MGTVNEKVCESDFVILFGMIIECNYITEKLRVIPYFTLSREK